jgi:hypothetical protein
MALALAQYIRFRRKVGNAVEYIPGFSFQNYFVAEIRMVGDVDYAFAPFIFSGTVSTDGSEMSESSIVMMEDSLSVPLAMQASLDRWLVEVKTVAISVKSPDSQLQVPGMVDLQPSFFDEAGVLSTQIWKCGAALKQYTEGENGESIGTITIPLMNALDATRRSVPGRVLTESLVGSAPSTGAISGA